MGILEKISEIEKEISRTQKNKGKNYFSSLIKLKSIIYDIIYHLFNKSLFHYFNLLCLCLCILATEYHLGLLKAKLAKYRAQLLEPSKKQEKGEGFDVLKSGDARVALIGFPSVGKVSTNFLWLLSHFNLKPNVR